MEGPSLNGIKRYSGEINRLGYRPKVHIDGGVGHSNVGSITSWG